MSGTASLKSGTLGALDPEGLLFERIGDAEAYSRKQSTTRQTVERRQFLGEHHRIAARDHEHAGAELQSRGARRRERQGDERIGSLTRDALAEPDRIETEVFEKIHEGCERVRPIRQCASAEPEPDTDLHDDDAIGRDLLHDEDTQCTPIRLTARG